VIAQVRSDLVISVYRFFYQLSGQVFNSKLIFENAIDPLSNGIIVGTRVLHGANFDTILHKHLNI